MSRTLLSLAGFQVIITGRFWVIAEANSNSTQIRNFIGQNGLKSRLKQCKYFGISEPIFLTLGSNPTCPQLLPHARGGSEQALRN